MHSDFDPEMRWDCRKALALSLAGSGEGGSSGKLKESSHGASLQSSRGGSAAKMKMRHLVTDLEGRSGMRVGAQGSSVGLRGKEEQKCKADVVIDVDEKEEEEEEEEEEEVTLEAIRQARLKRFAAGE